MKDQNPEALSSPGLNATASEKTLQVLEATLTHTRFTQIVDATGLAKATVHRILATLVESRFVAVAAEGNYVPGPRWLTLAGRALARLDISAIAMPLVTALVKEVRCTVHVGVVNGDEIIYLIRSDSEKPYTMPSRVGHAIPLHSSGIGKVVMAAYSEAEVAGYAMRTGLPQRTSNTIGTLEALHAELRDVRSNGYALDFEENVVGIGCVAAPIFDHTGTIRYGVSVSTLTVEHNLQQIQAMAPQVKATAADISASLGFLP